MITFETFVVLTITITIFCFSVAVPLYIKAKEAKDNQDKSYNMQGFKVIAGVSILLFFSVVLLRWSNDIIYLLTSKVFPFYRCSFSNLRFTFSYILGIVLSIIILVWELHFIHNNFKQPLKILFVLFTFSEFWNLTWVCYYASSFVVLNFRFESNLVFAIFTILSFLVVFLISWLLLTVLYVLLFVLLLLLYFLLYRIFTGKIPW